MIERLGTVLYWTATAIAALTALMGVYMAAQPNAYNPGGSIGFGLIVGGVIWLAGWAIRYILVGK